MLNKTASRKIVSFFMNAAIRPSGIVFDEQAHVPNGLKLAANSAAPDIRNDKLRIKRIPKGHPYYAFKRHQI
jgi:hypothetical protein